LNDFESIQQQRLTRKDRTLPPDASLEKIERLIVVILRLHLLFVGLIIGLDLVSPAAATLVSAWLNSPRRVSHGGCQV